MDEPDSIKNSDIEDALSSVNVKGVKSRDRAKSVLQVLKLKFKSYPWPDDDNTLIRKIEHALNKLRKIKLSKDQYELETWRKDLFIPTDEATSMPDADEVPPSSTLVAAEVPPIKAPAGRPRGSYKRLSDGTCKKTENKTLDEIVAIVSQKAEDHNYDRFEFLQLVNQRCRSKWKSDKDKVVDKYDVPVPDACAMMYNLNLSSQQYQEIRLLLQNYKFNIPARNKIDSYKKSLLPNITVENIKTFCKIKELITGTVSSLLKICNWQNTSPSIVSITSKFGLDGSGSHNIRHQKLNQDDVPGSSSTSYIGAFWCPLKLKAGDEVVWENPLTNSTLYCRPVCLMRGKETRGNIEDHFKPLMNDILALEKSSTPVNYDGTDHELSVHCEISMIDGKMVDLIQGDSGSFCHYCDVTKDEANKLENILNGFPITKTHEQVQQRWEQLASGEMAYSNPSRKGQCHEPMVEKDLRHFANLHSKLRSLDFCLKLLYHIESGQTHTWSESNANVLRAVNLAKEEVRRQIAEMCGLVLDQPTSNGGNTNNGPTADRFFNKKDREKICSVIRNTEDRDNFRILLCFFNKLLSITQRCDSNMVAIPDKVTKLGTALMVQIKEAFPFAVISPSVHQMAAHSGQLFELTEGRSIAVYAEQCGEAWNKYIRAYKSGPSARARQCSIETNTRDIFTRMMLQTHPFIATKKRQIQCYSCGNIGHSIMTCKSRFETVLDEEESEILNCYTK